MASISIPSVCERALRRVVILGALVLIALTALAATGPAQAGAVVHNRTTAAVEHPTAAVETVRRTLRQARQERIAAERALARLRAYQRDAHAAGLPVGRPHERHLAAALRHHITMLEKLERELSSRNSAATRPSTTKKSVSPPRNPETAEQPRKVAGAPAKNGVRSGAVNGRRAKAVAYARAQLGKPYRWGGTGPGSFDCSGLVMRAWQHAGVKIPRTTATQWRAGKHINRSQLQPGDLVFRNGRGHVMLYAGNGKVIHASRPGTPVRYAPLPPRSRLDGYVTFLT